MNLLLSTSIELSKVNILLALLFCIGWVVIAKPLQLYHNSSIRFAMANLMLALALLLDYQHQYHPTLYLWMIADIILLISFIIYHLALRQLFKISTEPQWLRWPIIIVVTVLSGFVVGWLRPQTVAIISLSLVTGVSLATLKMKYMELGKAFSVQISSILSIADLFIVLLVAAKIVFLLGLGNSDFETFFKSSLVLWLQVVLIILINTTSVGTTISRLIMRMKYLAEHDQLTGLLNRRAFQMQLNYQFSLYKRYQRPFSILMLDIDYFKSINDTYGHSAGDRAIVHTAKLLKQQIRQTDLVARFGGEEFIILLPDQSLDDAHKIASKICSALHQSTWQLEADPLTISIGCAEASQANTADKLLKLADDALYEAKANGRNQAVKAAR